MLNPSVVDDFLHDRLVVLLAILVALDLVLGVTAALAAKPSTFRFAYLTDFLRNDVLGKLVPFYAVWAAVHVTDISLDVAGLNVVQPDVIGAAVAASLGASILKSLADLGVPGARVLPRSVAGDDPNARL